MLMTAADPRVSYQGLKRAERETYEYPYTKAGDCRGSDGSCEPTLTFDPSEEASTSSHPERNRSSTAAEKASTFLSYQQHRRQQTTPLPGKLRFSTTDSSPTREHSRHLSAMPLTGDGKGKRRPDTSLENPASAGLTPDAAPRSSTETTPKSAPTTQSRFGFLSSITGRLTNQSTVSIQFNDELLDMDIQAALYPSPTDRDTFSPAAYKNLQTNAAGLLQRMQSAYRSKTIAFNDMQAERSAEKDEIDETKLRVESLKMQLEQMASKAAEQERQMQQLMGELKAEKKARHDDRMTRERLMANGSMVNEDLGVDEDERKKWRQSGNTIKSDNSFETDEESAESESVFSRSRSPTIMTNVTESVVDIPVTNSKAIALAAPPKPKAAKEMTTFQKLMKGISGETVKEVDEEYGPNGCNNCRGENASTAWDTVSLLRDENHGLKHRVVQLEVAVDGALDVVNGIGL